MVNVFVKRISDMSSSPYSREIRLANINYQVLVTFRLLEMDLLISGLSLLTHTAKNVLMTLIQTFLLFLSTYSGVRNTLLIYLN